MILLDTNIIIGYFSPQDSLHEQCKAELAGKNTNDFSIIPEVFWEAVSIVSVRDSSESAIQIGNILQEHFSFLDTKAIPRNALWKTFQKVAPHRFSYVDTVLYHLSQNGNFDILTFDEKLRKRIHQTKRSQGPFN